MSDDFEIITSLRSDQILRDSKGNAKYGTTANNGECQFYLLSYHRDRIVNACKAFKRGCESLEGEAGLAHLERQLNAQLSIFGGDYRYGEPVKLRVIFTKQEYFYVTAETVPAVPPVVLFPTNLSDILTLTKATYRVFVSPKHTSPSLFTRHKTTRRDQYDEERALLPPVSGPSREAGITHEMLLVNDYGNELMEGTFTTPYFYRNGEWITPLAACGGHVGVTRRWALANGLSREGIIMAHEVEAGEKVILSNGVRGFGWGNVAKPFDEL